ncbi:MAG: phosphate ABC transporter substrate-binding protein PstS [Gemmatimonadetes bacterium]|nr:phosphate ABC transporter substrate-binding protein PstS [Gemmatimonadota bacterium]MBI2536316.1 phosphate ABC transporter substrate-binding protein PstS [Gemmatimonadota bacterium]MBI2615735.1 phosphate ABC transporter substrate-binding protein PstS [Gemmatimonadota bacterium]
MARSLLVALIGSALALPAGAQIKLTGAGATFPNIIYQDWVLTYNKQTRGVQLNYQSIGSGGGIRQFSENTVDFGGSDAPMNDSAIAAVGGNVLHLPTVLGGLAVIYNLRGVSVPMRFTPQIVADMFLGRLTTWNDPRIAAVNPNVQLPRSDILVVHRSDGSGTTYVFTDYLSKVSPEWQRRVGRGTSVNWPVGLGGRGNEGVAATVAQTPGAVGYVELGYAEANQLQHGQVQNRTGQFVTPSVESVTAAAAGAMAEMGPDTDFRVSITNPGGAGAYPIASFTWLLLRKQYADAAKAGALVSFVWWAVTEGQAVAPRLGYAPLPPALRPWIETRLKTITAGGRPVWPGPK